MRKIQTLVPVAGDSGRGTGSRPRPVPGGPRWTGASGQRRGHSSSPPWAKTTPGVRSTPIPAHHYFPGVLLPRPRSGGSSPRTRCPEELVTSLAHCPLSLVANESREGRPAPLAWLSAGGAARHLGPGELFGSKWLLGAAGSPSSAGRARARWLPERPPTCSPGPFCSSLKGQADDA